MNTTGRSKMSRPKLKLLYARAPQIVASALLVIGLAASAQQSSDKPVISLSTVSRLDRSQAGIYRTKIGKIDVIAVSDGTVGLGLTKELVQNAKPGEVERLLARHFEKSPLDASVNAFLIKYENKLILIDAGSSELVGPTGGKLPQSLRAAGAPPENITDVFVTHIHPDHTGGLMNGNTKVFPNATIHINKREVDYWFNKSIAATAVEPQKTFFAQVDPKVKPYMDSGQLKTFEGATTRISPSNVPMVAPSPNAKLKPYSSTVFGLPPSGNPARPMRIKADTPRIFFIDFHHHTAYRSLGD